MPNYKTHLFGGIAAYLLLFYFCIFFQIRESISPIFYGIWFIAACAGSLFPDIDTKSRGQRYFYWALFFILTIAIFQKDFAAVSLCGIAAIAPLLGRHRGLYHRLWFVIGAPFLIALFYASKYPHLKTDLLLTTSFFVFGAISHLWLDLGFWRMVRKW